MKRTLRTQTLLLRVEYARRRLSASDALLLFCQCSVKQLKIMLLPEGNLRTYGRFLPTMGKDGSCAASIWCSTTFPFCFDTARCSLYRRGTCVIPFQTVLILNITILLISKYKISNPTLRPPQQNSPTCINLRINSLSC